MAHSLPALPYDAAALEPHIDKQTMEIHHGKHHQAYVTNLNAALDKHPELHNKVLDDLIKNINSVPDDIKAAVRNNGGGHWNHSFFWKLMGPNPGRAPTGAVADAIKGSFGDFEKFKTAVNQAGTTRFGSGWAWVINNGGKLEVMSTPNQDNPLMEGKKAILGIDVWEHAYYLRYQNRRPDYLGAWWDVVNWDDVGRRYGEASRYALLLAPVEDGRGRAEQARAGRVHGHREPQVIEPLRERHDDARAQPAVQLDVSPGEPVTAVGVDGLQMVNKRQSARRSLS